MDNVVDKVDPRTVGILFICLFLISVSLLLRLFRSSKNRRYNSLRLLFRLLFFVAAGRHLISFCVECSRCCIDSIDSIASLVQKKYAKIAFGSRFNVIFIVFFIISNIFSISNQRNNTENTLSRAPFSTNRN